VIKLRKMRSEEFADYQAYFIEDYARDLQDNSGHDRETAIAIATLCLPAGVENERESLFCIMQQHTRVGYLWYRLSDDKNWAFINDFYVLPQYRSLGYGKLAINAMEQNLVAINVDEIRLRVAANNPRALKLYEHLGFNVSGYNMSKKLQL